MPIGQVLYAFVMSSPTYISRLPFFVDYYIMCSGAAIGTFLFLVIIWTGLIHGHKWAFWVLLAAGIFGHTLWFVGDRFIGNQILIVNCVLTALFLIGICLAGYGIFVQ